MTDDGSRSFRRDSYSRDDGAQHDSDPLAELARLIGQSETYGGGSRGRAQKNDEATPLPELDWAAGDQHYAHDDDEGDRYATPTDADRYHDDRAAPPRYAPPAGFAERQSEYAEDDGYHDQTRLPPGPPSLPYISPLNAGEQQAAERSHGTLTPAYESNNARDDYDDHEGPSARRRGTIVGLAILGVVVLGTAGAFGYHAMFGGSFIPSLPPIIKPGNTPVKIVPKEAQAAPGNQTTVAKGPAVQLVPHQEKPVEVHAANPPPRVITTIPVVSNAPVMPVQGPPPAPSPPATAPALPAAPAQAIAPPDQPSGPASAGPASGSKPVHTVIIKPQPSAQAGSPGPTGTASAAHPRPSATKPVREPEWSASAGGPLSIVPSQEPAPRQPAAQHSRTAMAHSDGPIPLNSSHAAEAAPPRGGGYAVQVSSQHSEDEAQASFRSLQAKFPHELGGRHAEFRRADLGAKGIYYRALVGPFASAEQASSMCRSLKAAGGSCLVQRN